MRSAGVGFSAIHVGGGVGIASPDTKRYAASSAAMPFWILPSIVLPSLVGSFGSTFERIHGLNSAYAALDPTRLSRRSVIVRWEYRYSSSFEEAFWTVSRFSPTSEIKPWNAIATL